ncbi:winged helix-turn-helix transcriptional regulator [Paenibacillus silvae]|uniref:winged helix-turn-helix transcriptional regulator n=1 Tax=Paenibacillus silvae TaxID=1325358 RepID=UPI00119DC608|nr:MULTISPECIES: helix-turn-helix domain-containing protein [Paenibacillus]MCK6073221.1 helix-turn-helix transcriptional regulator [Paenibacillus silvae]MCK6149303.1 helix-turn-helix transcriptional regulator [Paenibacillus silvae]MCK6267602.1 helix-turn-helix transcriptional regulator [Paenibacillus silvae]
MAHSAKTKQSDISLSNCGYSKVLDIISDKWTALVIYAMENGKIRYGEMLRRVEGISKKMLTQTVRKLERDGLVQRHITPTVPITVEYSLTTLGEILLQPMKELRQWGREHYDQVVEARVQYDSASTEGSREADNISG